ncbi:surfactant protein C-like [Gastrophryne carolinensis]
MKDHRKTWAWSMVVLILLAIIAVGATLIGVYMTQKHIEKVVEMAFHDKNGESVEQTIMVNNKENLAAFYVNTNNVSSIILYDYNREVIAFRRTHAQKCYVMEMKNVRAPSMKDILNSLSHFQRQNLTSESDLTYDVVEGEEADRTQLGVPINILCGGTPIFWATQNNSPHQRWKLSIKFSIFGVDILINFES